MYANRDDPSIVSFHGDSGTGGWDASRTIDAGGQLSTHGTIGLSSVTAHFSGVIDVPSGENSCNFFYGCPPNPGGAIGNTSELPPIIVYVLGPPGTKYHVEQQATGNVLASVSRSNPYNNWAFTSATAGWRGDPQVDVHSDGPQGYNNVPPPKQYSKQIDEHHTLDGFSTGPTITYQGRTYSYAVAFGNRGYVEIPVGFDHDYSAHAEFNVNVSVNATTCTQPFINTQPVNQTILNGQTATLSANALSPTPLTYQWYQGQSGDTSNPIAGATASSYTTGPLNSSNFFWVRISNECGAVDSNTVLVSVLSCTLGCSANVPQSGGLDASITFTAASTPSHCPSSPTYDWEFGDNSPHSSEKSPVHLYNVPGTYAWKLTVSTPGAAPCVRTGLIEIRCPARVVVETPQVRMLPSLTHYDKNGNATTTVSSVKPMSIKVVDQCTSAQVGGAQVKIDYHTLTGSGGHDHDRGALPGPSERDSVAFAGSFPGKGTFSPETGISSTSFPISPLYTAPELSGTVEADVQCSFPDTRRCDPARITMNIEVPDLEPFPFVPELYDLTGQTINHSSNHWGKHIFNEALKNLAITYHNAYRDSKLEFNDMSLAQGGLFDIHGTWNKDHGAHRCGTEVDLGLVNAQRFANLLKWIHAQNMWVHVEPDKNHWHVGLDLRFPPCSSGGQIILQAPTGPGTESLKVQLAAQVTQDPLSGLYTYQYSFTNDASSADELSTVQIPLADAVVFNLKAPQGWSPEILNDELLLDFTATEIGELPPDYVPDGKLIPSPYQVKPGQSLNGFSFQSPYPPTQMSFNASGFKQLPVLGVDIGDSPESPAIPPEFISSYTSTTDGPAFPASKYQNKIDDPWYFIRQQYRDFLNREPDAGGIGYWAGQITQCGSNSQCINSRRIGTADAFFFEAEFQQTGAFIYRVYKAALGQRPGYLQFSADRGQIVAGAALDASKAAFTQSFAGRDAFLQRFPRSQTAPQFVDALLNQLKQNSGVDLTTDRTALLGLYDGTDAGRGSILKRVADTQALIDAEYNNSFVLMEYFGYLRRDPDPGGFEFWLSQVNRFPLRNVAIQHAMACSFITSAEYQVRFGYTITHTNRECPQ
jgi:PKD repeat protein